MDANGRLLRRLLQVAAIVLCCFAPNYECQLQTSAPYDLVFVANLDPPGIFKAPASTFNFTIVPGLEDDLGVPVAIDYDPVDRMVYWTDATRSTISRALVDGTSLVVLVSNLLSPVGICLDVGNRMMYWTDKDSQLIEKATMDGLDRTVVFDMSANEDHNLRAIVVDTNTRRLYWTVWGGEPMIERANTDGGSRTVLVNTDLDLPSGLALDTSGGRLYWCDARLSRIESVDLDGGSRQQTEVSGTMPFDIWFYRGDLYWSDFRYQKLIQMQLQPLGATLHGSASFLKAGGLHIHEDTSRDHSCVDYSPCGTGQRCRQFQTHHECVCKDGLDGLQCQQDNPCSRTCNNDGVCLQSSQMAGDAFCQCPERYTGTNCETFVPICRSNPCLNGGTCVDELPDESFRCECLAGFVGETCDRESHPFDRAFVANLDPPGIFVAPTDTFNFTLIPGLEDDLSRPVAIDYDPVDGMVYWTDVVRKSISRALLDGSGVVVLVTGLSLPDGFSLDVDNRVMYWTDEGTDLIERATLDGKDRAVVIDLRNESIDEVKPRAIVVDPINDHLYWTDWGSYPKIERANTDGSSRTVLVDTGLQHPNGVALDFDGGRMYWCDAALDLIQSTDLEGDDRRVHGELIKEKIHPFDLWFYRGRVFWTDWRFQRILRMDLEPKTVVTFFGSVTFLRAGGMHIYTDYSTGHECRDPAVCQEGERCRQYKTHHTCVCKDGLSGASCELDNPCEPSPCENEGSCHLSASSEGGFFCQCPSRYIGEHCETFVPICRNNPCLNGGTCHEESPESFRCECLAGFIGDICDRKSNPYDRAFVANLDPPGIFVAPTDTFNFTLIPGLEDTLGRPVAIDYDPVDGMVYWTDIGHKSISRALLDGTGIVVLVTGLSHPFGFSLDVDNRVMYWTDEGTDLIERASLDGKYRAVVIDLRNESIDEVKPRAIVVDTNNNHLYWTDWGSYPKIERANTDGSSRTVLVDTGLQHPNGVALDFDGGRMYWCDAALDTIESTDLQGDDRRVHSELTKDKIHPFDLWFYRGKVFWTDWRFQQILRMDLEPETVVTFFGSVTFLRAGGMHIYTDYSTGHECRDPAVCQEGERCRQYKTHHTCVCKDGLSGASCELDNPCESSPCENEGSCHLSASSEGDFFCLCQSNYEGAHCETFVPPCSSSPCMNGGTCIDDLPDNFHCECSSGYTGRICEDESKPYDWAFVANIDPPGIFVAPADTFNFTLIPDLEDKLEMPVAIDYDPVDDMVYWTDKGLSTISRAFLDGTGLLILVSGVNYSEGLSLDVENRMMYWTDTGSDLIESATMDGQDRAVILNLTNHSMPEMRPIAIIVDSTNRHLYWTEIGSEPKIERMNTDGTSRQVLVGTGLGWPNGLALDMQGGRMYWGDAKLHRLESADLQGNDRRVLGDLSLSEAMPFDVWFYRGMLYWTDWRYHQILGFDFLAGTTAYGYGSSNLQRAGGLHIYSDDASSDHTCSDSEPCRESERCRQFQDRHQCVCKDGPDGAKCKLANKPCRFDSCNLAGDCFRSASINDDGYFCKCLPRYSGKDCETKDRKGGPAINLGPGNDNLGNDS